jgi:hypothetical protein
MKLEFVSEGSPDCPLIRLFDFCPAEAARLLAAITHLVSGAAEQVALHELAGVEAVSGCRLTLCVRPWDQAVVAKGTPADFECGFTRGTWDNVAGLVEPFAHGEDGFQWLAGVPGEASLLLSPSGQW